MTEAALLAVDDDPPAVRDIERELRDRYASNYRCSVGVHPGWSCRGWPCGSTAYAELASFGS